MRRKPNYGLTFIEVLVVIVSAVVLACLLLPAVQGTRGPNRRSHCKINLKQLGLALHSYQCIFGTFPPGLISQVGQAPNFCDFGWGGTGVNQSGHSGLTLLLPYIEEKGVYDAYNFQIGCSAPQNSTAVAATIKTFICPSNSREFKDMLPPSAGFAGPAAPTDYVFNLGAAAVLHCDANLMGGDPDQIIDVWGKHGEYRLAAGPFGINRGESMRAIQKDGIANTILMGESAGGPMAATTTKVVGGVALTQSDIADAIKSNAFADQAWATGFISNGTTGTGSVFAAVCHNCEFDTTSSVRRVVARSGATAFNILKINEARLAAGRRTFSRNTAPGDTLVNMSVQGFRSYHTNMSQFLFADGSVRPVHQHIDDDVLIAFGTLQGQEPIPEP